MAAAKKRRNTKKTKERIRCEVKGIAMIALAVLIFLGMQKGEAGVFGGFFRDYIFGLFGIAGYGIPLFILIAGIIFILRINTAGFENKALALFLLYFSLLVLIHMLSGDGQMVMLRKDSSLWQNLRENSMVAFGHGMEKQGGGIVGGIFSVLFYSILGPLGSKITVAAFALICATILTDLSFVSLLFKLIKGILVVIKNSGQALRDFVMVPAEPEKEVKISMHREQVKQEEPAHVNPKQEDSIKIFDYANPQRAAAETAATDVIEDVGFHKTNIVNEYPGYRLPPTGLLKEYESKKTGNRKELLLSARKLEDTLNTFGVVAKVIQVSVGPTITRYELQPSPGVKVSRILNLSDDIALSMAATSVRIEAPIPGKSAIGLEVPNRETVPVLLREIIESSVFKNNSSNITVALGKDIAGNPVVVNLSEMPHLLIAGATGSGKSVCINGIITSLLYKASPAHVKLILVDPKMVELSHYNGIPHLLAPVVTDPRKATAVLNWVVQEMTNRYKEFARTGVKDIHRYNQVKQLENSQEYLPQIVVVIDELSDLMMVSPAEVEDAICRLAQMARASGIYLVVATQRPSVDVITGIIKANIPSRISFAVSSQVDSRTILDMSGAEKLTGKGDMLYHPTGEQKPVRVQGALVEEEEIEKVVSFIKNQVEASYSEEVLDAAAQKDTDRGDCDDLLSDAIAIALDFGQASASLMQRKLKIGYARAARIIDQMEERGIISGFEGSKPRKLLITKEDLKVDSRSDK
ncbi:MAG: DNA translocase FtsK [Bacillota bacterium]|nr:DNA translocase FtsK [Bacillota bacterium]MDD3297278.1 DNA translocase FtsK [Bacillota bacterium]MDD3850458.1 DNA translocase FtsK [Bacillota bacterium]MDD4706794.1 DNA translocase FtsK [Bacillota bacterium]